VRDRFRSLGLDQKLPRCAANFRAKRCVPGSDRIEQKVWLEAMIGTLVIGFTLGSIALSRELMVRLTHAVCVREKRGLPRTPLQFVEVLPRVGI